MAAVAAAKPEAATPTPPPATPPPARGCTAKPAAPPKTEGSTTPAQPAACGALRAGATPGGNPSAPGQPKPEPGSGGSNKPLPPMTEEQRLAFAQQIKPLRQRIDSASEETSFHEQRWAELPRNLAQAVIDQVRDVVGRIGNFGNVTQIWSRPVDGAVAPRATTQGQQGAHQPPAPVAQAPAISSSPTLVYVDWNGSLNDLAALGSRVVPGGKNIKQLMHNSMPMLDKLTKELAALNMGDAVRLELGFATDGKNPLADMKSPPHYGAILRINTQTLGAYKDLKQPVIAKVFLTSGINPPLANKLAQNIVDAANKRGGFGNLSEIRLNFNPRPDGGVDVLLGYAVAATVKKGNSYGFFFVNVRGPVNHTNPSKPGNQADGQIVLALGGGKGIKTGAAEVAVVRVINYRNTPSSQGFVRDQRTGEVGVLVVHQGKPSFYGLGPEGRAIAESITGRKAQDVPQADLPAVTAQQLADDLDATLPKAAIEQARKLTGVANAAQPWAEFASDAAQIVVAPAIAPNPWTIGNALLRAHGLVEESDKAVRDRMIQDGTVSGKNMAHLHRMVEGAPDEEKGHVIKQLSLAIKEGIESGRLDGVDTCAAWQRLQNRSAFPKDELQLVGRHTGYREGFSESFTFPMPEFGQAVTQVILDGKTSGPPSTIAHALSGIRVEPLPRYIGPSISSASMGRELEGRFEFQPTPAGPAAQRSDRMGFDDGRTLMGKTVQLGANRWRTEIYVPHGEQTGIDSPHTRTNQHKTLAFVSQQAPTIDGSRVAISGRELTAAFLDQWLRSQSLQPPDWRNYRYGAQIGP